MKRERQVKIYLGIIIIIFVLMTFLLPLGKQTSSLLKSINTKIDIPIGMNIDNMVNNINKEVFEIANKKYIVIYQDGLDNKIFQQEIYYNCTIDNIPKFKGNTSNNKYKFIGWLIEKEDNQIIYTATYEKSS